MFIRDNRKLTASCLKDKHRKVWVEDIIFLLFMDTVATMMSSQQMT